MKTSAGVRKPREALAIFSFDKASGAMKFLRRMSTALAEDEESQVAKLLISSDGRFLYSLSSKQGRLDVLEIIEKRGAQSR